MQILIVDDDADLLSLMCDFFRDHGCGCFGLGSYDAVTQHRCKTLSSDLIILDVNLGPAVPSGVDVYRWLQEHGYKGRVIFLTGHAKTFPKVSEAFGLGVEVLEKPLTIERLKELVSS